jgi:hypothetical protein
MSESTGEPKTSHQVNGLELLREALPVFMVADRRSSKGKAIKDFSVHQCGLGCDI